jgi:peptide/nickel transport system permease protein
VDQLGRDEWSRIIYGARYSLAIGVVAVSVGLSIGLVLGAIAGYLGGFVDGVIMRAMDVMLAIPGLLLAIGIVAALGAGIFQIMIAVGVTNIPIFARLLRGVDPPQRGRRLRARGAVGRRARRRILASHILPNAISVVIVAATLALATAIIDVAGLGLLGLGPRIRGRRSGDDADGGRPLPPERALARGHPGIAIVLLVLGFNLIGDGLREAFDPKLRNRV